MSLYFLRILILSVIFGNSFQAISQTLQDSLKAYYKFDGNAADSSGNNHHATEFNGVSYSVGKFGDNLGAIQFDGVDDYVNTFTSFDFQERTVSAWVLPQVFTGFQSNSTEQTILDQNSFNLNHGMFKLYAQSQGFGLVAGGESSHFHYTSVQDDNWFHIAMVRRANSTSYYINGQLVGTGVSGVVGSFNGAYENLVVGCGRSRNMQFFNGKVDELRIYSRALSTQEVEELYALNPYGTICTTYDTIIVYDTVVINQVINRNDLTIGVKAYPNPTSDITFLDLANTQQKTLSYTIIDQNSRKVFKDQTNSETLVIDFQALNIKRGVYTILIQYEESDETKLVRVLYH